MFDHRLLTREMAALGCVKQDKLTYGLPSVTASLKWNVTFRLLGVYRWEIDGAVRCIHEEAAVFGRKCLREHAGDWWKNALAKHPELGGGVGCPIANLAPWSAMHSLNIKNFTAEGSASQVARDIDVYVLPFVASVQSEPQFLKLLLADEKPMLWHHGQPLQRFAESAWLCKRLGTDVNVALAALERQRALLQGQLFDQTLDAYAAHVLHSLRSEA